MRVEDGEKDKLELRLKLAREKFSQFALHLTSERKRESYWREVAVPYVKYYAYEEILAPFGNKKRSGEC